MNEPKFKAKDKVWSIYWFIRHPINYGTPYEQKIYQVVQLKDGTYKYNTQVYCFTDEWIGKVIFYTKEEALNFVNNITSKDAYEIRKALNIKESMRR